MNDMTNTATRFFKVRAAALAVLQGDSKLSRKAGSFLGQCVADPTPLSAAQAEWFGQLCERAGIEWEGLQ